MDYAQSPRADGYSLGAKTKAGQIFVTAAESHIGSFRERAAQHDLDGSFPFENFEDMRSSGVLAAAIPAEYGGLGVESLHDLMIGLSRIGRGDAATAIAANMHIAGGAVIVRMLRQAQATSATGMIDLLEDLLRKVGQEGYVMCFPTTEPGTDLATPMCELTPAEGGYKLNGFKIFATVSPAAHLFFPSVRIPKDDGGYLTGTVMIPRGAPGMVVGDTWDAMGMRASGSNSIHFKDCFVPSEMLFGVRDNYGQIGRGFADFALIANLPLISSFLGIAESAREVAEKTVNGQRKGLNAMLLGDRIPIQILMAEIDVDIAVCRALIERLGFIADAFLLEQGVSDTPSKDSAFLMKEVQCMKYVVNRKVIEVVDRAMTVTGGGAYMNNNALPRLYRDARAGPFMQPFAPYEALEYIGKIALGREPALCR